MQHIMCCESTHQSTFIQALKFQSAVEDDAYENFAFEDWATLTTGSKALRINAKVFHVSPNYDACVSCLPSGSPKVETTF